MLVVDDEPDTAELVGFLIAEDSRCEAVETAASGEEALLALAETDPDTIVCDHHLGGRTSDEYLPGFKSAAPSARIIVHSGDPHGAQADGVIRRGADLVVEKDPTRLNNLVDEALDPTPPTGD